MAFGLKLRKVPLKLRDESKITAKTADGKKLNFIARLFKRTLQEARDENGLIITDENGNVKYAAKTDKKGREKKDGKGNIKYKTRRYNIDEYAGPIVYDEHGAPVLVALKDKNGNIKKDKNGETVYKLVKLTKYEIRQKVEEAARILDIMQYLDRKPKAMSGGQRQRVALGRAIVREPKVFLLDEPLSNLDAKLRTAMRSEISKLYKRLQTTFVYVTHDQVEAMTMGTRIVVMKSGFVQQIDTPRNLYSYPVNKFVAGFIGTPQMNFFNCKLRRDGGNIKVSLDETDIEFTVPQRYFAKADASYFDGVKPVVLGVRPEHVSVVPDQYPFKAKCKVFYVEDLGVESQVYANFNTGDSGNLMETPTKVIIKAPAATAILADSIIEVSLDFANIQVFDAETERTIAPRIPERLVTSVSVSGGKMTLLGAELTLPSAIALADGNYEAAIPTTALALGGAIKGKCVGEELINGKRLVELNVNGASVFVVAGKEDKTDGGLSVDLKYCTFISDGNTVKESMPFENSLSTRLSRIKKNVDGSERKVCILHFKGTELECPANLAKRLLLVAGKEIFKDDLSVRFGVYDACEGETGIAAEVETIEDYGKERFAKCRVGDETVYMAVDDKFDKKQIVIGFDWNKISVVDTAQDIRLI
ncbi:MAG: ATP-binding cassette domain-containing protein [Clostridia bacterium]|nr:ATP-binding cassette domain-containing protein [Clostridia bacterium]